MKFFEIFGRRKKNTELKKDELFSKITGILIDQLKIENIEKINLDSRLREDLDIDSTEGVELVMVLEEEFGLEIPDKDALKIITVGEAVNYLFLRLEKKDIP